MIRGAVIGKRFDDCTFDSFTVNGNSKAFDGCKAVADNKTLGVVLYGSVGTGKTHLLVALAREASKDAMGNVNDEGVYDVVQRARTVEFWPVLDLASALREEIALGEHAIARRCCECDLLILDDLGAERSTDFVLEALERIIDYRYRDEKAIAIGTNLSPEQIAQRYGDRPISRWAQSCEVVMMKGADYRLSKNKPLDK